MPAIITRGAVSAQGYGYAGSASTPVYIEDVFSTYLYTGTGASQTITNGINLSGKGGLVWLKGRSGATDHALYDTARGATFDIASNTTAAQTTQATGLTSFGSTGFTIGALAKINTSSATYVSWAFRKQAKFFDVVTYTGNGAGSQLIAHSLGTKPAWIMVKRTNSTSNWFHFAWNGIDGVGGFIARSLSLNSTNAAGITTVNGTNPHTATTFDTGEISDITGTNPNVNSATYVAYLFATNAGGFGATGTDNVISCGSFTTDGSGNATVSLGYEPQWLLFKNATSTQGWALMDVMRGMFVGGGDVLLQANIAGAEGASSINVDPNSTGFSGSSFIASSTYIYIAIRRGPMKTPTSGTSVFYTTDTNAEPTGSSRYVGFPADMQITGIPAGGNHWVYDRLRGVSSNTTSSGADLKTNLTDAESTAQAGTRYWGNVYIQVPTYLSGTQAYFWNFRRAPGFFDVVCYDGNGTNRTINHNLGVVPELMIVKSRSNAFSWVVYSSAIGATKYLQLASNAAPVVQSQTWNDTAPTSSVFTVGILGAVNASSSTFVNYLFASCPGVSKVGSYTGTGTTKQIDCGFTAGASFILIKRTDSTGDWYVWDSNRGISPGNDPYFLLNTSGAQVTSTDYIDTYSAGFEISSTAPAAINANGGSFIFLAIA